VSGSHQYIGKPKVKPFADPETTAKMVLLRDKHGLSFATIAMRFGCSESTVAKTYKTAKTPVDA
jgi:DNA-binding transcriptional regulator YiaG